MSMSFIEGVGDEVFLCFCGLLGILLLVFAWTSTWVQDPFLMGRFSITITRERSSLIDNDTTDNVDTAPAASENTSEVTNSSLIDNVDTSRTETVITDNIDTGTSQTETDKATAAGDTPTTGTVGDDQQSEVDADNSQNDTNTDNPKELSELRLKRLQHLQPSTTKQSESSENIQENIVIKLKYLNDDMRSVGGKLNEKLGEFKLRHFAPELDSNKRVKLIFNGHLLSCDSKTLGNYGMFNDCVVHCHVAPPLSAPPTVDPQEELDLDLGHLMMPLFFVIVGIIWYCWFEFGQLFSSTATVALIGITALLFFWLFAIYVPVSVDRINFNIGRNFEQN